MFSLFHLYRKPCCFSTLVAHCCPEATNQYFVQILFTFYDGYIIRDPQAPKKWGNIFFPPQNKKSCHRGLIQVYLLSILIYIGLATVRKDAHNSFNKTGI